MIRTKDVLDKLYTESLNHFEKYEVFLFFFFFFWAVSQPSTLCVNHASPVNVVVRIRKVSQYYMSVLRKRNNS